MKSLSLLKLLGLIMICSFCAAEGLDESNKDNQEQKTPSNGDFLRHLLYQVQEWECPYHYCTVHFQPLGCTGDDVCCCATYPTCGHYGDKDEYGCLPAT
jgi:hypothetical protein